MMLCNKREKRGLNSMDSKEAMKPHALCIPLPEQGHITPMLKFAKILNSKGFIVTFVNTDFSHQRLLNSMSSDTLRSIPSFRFETIPDGLPPEGNHDGLSRLKSVIASCTDSVKNLMAKVNASDAPVTCIVSDVFMGVTLTIAQELGIPGILFYVGGIASLILFDQHPKLVQKGLVPFTDSTNLDTILDFIPTMNNFPLKYIGSSQKCNTKEDEPGATLGRKEIERAKTLGYGIIVNSFLELESDRLGYLSTILPIYDIGPLNLLENKIGDGSLTSIKPSLLKEETGCLRWLDSKGPSSVIYVNFGSTTMMTPQKIMEFCWGLAKSKCSFLLIIRLDLMIGDSTVLPQEFLEEINNKGLLASWCPQEEVLSHPSIGGFLTHCGWNSTIESISNGVPMICWPFFADHFSICWSCCEKWKIAMELNHDVKSDEVVELVTELMTGEKGKMLRKNAIDLKNKAEKACGSPLGSSVVSLEKVIRFLQVS